MKRIAYLQFTDGCGNHNKFYKMIENDDGEISVVYGRVGTAGTTVDYGFSKSWEALKSSKLKKGYEDVTKYHLESSGNNVKVEVTNDNIKEPESKEFFNDIYGARQKFEKEYRFKLKDITKQALEDSGKYIKVLNEIKNDENASIGRKVFDFNYYLRKIYLTFPRVMADVQANLARGTEDFERIISEETKRLESLELIYENHNTKANVECSFSMERATYDEEDKIMQSFTKRSYRNSTKSEDKFLRAFKVRNEKTDEAFDRYCNANPRAGGNRRILFHGTEKRNLYSIAESGLIIQKVWANGRAFGNGLYFAEQPEKSIGYTSVGNARWTNGNEDKSVLLLYEVALGKMDVVHSVDHSLSGKEMKRLGCDSVFAKGKCEDGQAVFENNEFIIYNKDACTIRYMSEQSRYPMNYAIPFDERMKMRFDADGIDLKMDGNEITFRIEEMPKETEKIMRAYFGDDLDGIAFRLDTESGMLSAENGNKIVNPRINGADMRWISRQLKREYAESEAKWKEFVDREIQKSKSRQKKGAER